MTIGESIKFYRKKKKLTQKKLGEMCNLAEITIRQYEADKYIPKIGNLQKISIALNVPFTDLLDVNGDIPWAALATEYPDSPIITRGNTVSVGVTHSEESAYIQQITYSLGLLNKEGLKNINAHLQKILSKTDYLKSSTTE